MSSAALLADAVVLLHFGFIAFVAVGAVLLWRWPRLVWLHLPALVWAAWVTLTGAECPLTPLELGLRADAGLQGYSGGFIEHHLIPLIYPPGLTRTTQTLIGAVLVLANVVGYGLWLRSQWRRRARRST